MVYHYTFLYKGEIVDKNEKPKKYSIPYHLSLIGCQKLYCDNFAALASMAPIIQPDEVRQEVVSLKRVLKIVEDNSKLKAEWGTHRDNSDIFICQGFWNTSGEKTRLVIEHNLPCHD